MPRKGYKHTGRARIKISEGKTKCFITNKTMCEYLNGKSANKIGKELGFCTATIIDALHRSGIKTRGKGKPIGEKPSRSYFETIAKRTLRNFGYEFQQEETIHHIDRNIQNNNIKNLLVFENNSQHTRWHRWDKDKHPNDDGWTRLFRAIIGVKN